MILKRKRIVLSIIAIMVLVAGYINWAYTQPVEEAPVSAPVSVETEIAVPENEIAAKARQSRDSARDKSREMLRDAINNPSNIFIIPYYFSLVFATLINSIINSRLANCSMNAVTTCFTKYPLVLHSKKI